jgi:23S rRNA pseudouridine1911/1915/1917 synthase
MKGKTPIELLVGPDEAGLRLELFVRARIPGISRGSIRRLLERGQVLVEGRREPKGFRVSEGQQVLVAVASRDERPVPQPELELDLVEVLDDLVVINKPAGVSCHPLVPGETDTVANALAARFPECVIASPQLREGGLVHRLDWSTSGVLLAARDQRSYGRWRGLFSSHQVLKRYLALVSGAVEEAGEIRSLVRTLPGDPTRMEVVYPNQPDHGGKQAETSYRPLEDLGPYTLIEVSCRTGLRHQVRVHLAHVGHPLLGDDTYGGPSMEGVEGAVLHARSVRARIEDEETEFRAPLPPEREQLLTRLGASL